MTQKDTEPQLDDFAAFARLPDAAMQLDQGAALIAAEGSDVDVGQCLALLDKLAAGARSGVESSSDALSRLRSLVDYLSKDCGLRGNTKDYYDPRNSFINDVVERRLGIPISLSVIYVEVAKRLDIPLDGVGFPAHFLIRHSADPQVFIDPFVPERFLDEGDCADLLRELSNGKMKLNAEHLQPVSTRQILVRMLANLKIVYSRREEFEKAVMASTRILLLVPDGTSEFRDRGMSYCELGAFRLAREDLGKYLDLLPGASDCFEVKQALAIVEERIRMLH